MIVVDVETSGTNPETCSLLSIGAVDFSDPRNTFYAECRLFDGAEVSEKALEVNGFTHAQITDVSKPSEAEIMKQFVFWVSRISDRTVAGQNVGFDLGFLSAAAARAGIEISFGHRSVDLHSLCYARHLTLKKQVVLKGSRSNLSLDAVLVFVGLPEEPKPHHGLVGAKMEAEAFSRLLFARGLFSEFASYAVPSYLE